MTPTSNYKMSKSAKIFLAMTWDRPGKTSRKKSVIQAELASKILPKAKKNRNDED